MNPPSSGKFSTLLLEGLDHYRKGKMMEAVRAWEEAYMLEPTNLRAREFLRSALERIHAHMGPGEPAQPAEPAPHPWLPQQAGKAPPARPAAEPATVANPARAAAPVDSRAKAAAPVDPRAKAAAPVDPRARYAAPVDPRPRAATNKMPVGPWDEGPSIAIPQEQEQAQNAGDESSGAWSIHKAPLPIEAVASDEVEVWLNGARELVALNDFSGALELTNKILARKQGDKEAQQIHELCEHNLTQMFESKIGSMEAVPRVSMPPDEIIWLNLDPRAGFVLAQIDGEVTFEDLYAICGLRQLDTARILSQLLEEGVVAVHGERQAVAKRALHRR